MPAAANHDELTGNTPDEATSIPETDGGPPRVAKDGHEPERRCIATMESHPQSRMIRFVLSPEGEVTPDLAHRLPGRGAWVIATREAIETAVKKNAFARAFKGKVRASAELSGQVENLLIKRALDQLGLVKRAGDLILGFEKVREAVRTARPGCLIEASDGAEDGRQKLMSLLLGAHGPDRSVAAPPGNDERPENQGLPPVIGCFSSDELGMALGRERVIHACLKQGRFAQNWMGELKRLSGFRRVWPEDWQPSSARGGGRPEADASHDAAAGQKN